MKMGGLFSGIGGFELGFTRAGYDVRWQVENDPFCVKVLGKNFPGVKRFGDIREIKEGELEYVDVVAGGFPCQDLSFAGKREGINGSRSGLWAEMHRVIRMVRPRFVVVENVPGILKSGMGRVLGDLAASGYDSEWDSIPAVAFGAPHLRYRVFIIAHANGHGCDTERQGPKQHKGQALPEPGTSSEQRKVAPNSSGVQGSYSVKDGTVCLKLPGAVRLWPTPTASAAISASGVNARIHNGSPENLGAAVRLWPTPIASSGGQNGTTPQVKKGQHGINLKGAVGLFPTPMARQRGPDLKRGTRNANGGDDLITALHREDPTQPTRLNSQFVEWMMGFPKDWTTIEDSGPRSGKASPGSSRTRKTERPA